MVKHGIDVSKFQGLIDWQEVKKHIDFAIIRCGYGSNLESQDDPYFKRNADECTRLKIPFGVYLYSYATNEREALSEAEHVLRLVKDYQMAYPVYYDLEDNNISLDDFFRNDTKKICVCEIDNAYTFNEAEINSTDWKLATYIPVEILKNL